MGIGGVVVDEMRSSPYVRAMRVLNSNRVLIIRKSTIRMCVAAGDVLCQMSSGASPVFQQQRKVPSKPCLQPLTLEEFDTVLDDSANHENGPGAADKWYPAISASVQLG